MLKHPDPYRFKQVLDQIRCDTDHEPVMIDMRSQNNPACGTPGCFGGELWLALGKIPEAQEYITPRMQNNPGCYSFDEAGQWFSSFVFDRVYVNYEDYYRNAFPIPFRKWARNNPALWGNAHGEMVFLLGHAWGQNSNLFRVSVIRDHLQQVLNRIKELPDSAF